MQDWSEQCFGFDSPGSLESCLQVLGPCVYLLSGWLPDLASAAFFWVYKKLLSPRPQLLWKNPLPTQLLCLVSPLLPTQRPGVSCLGSQAAFTYSLHIVLRGGSLCCWWPEDWKVSIWSWSGLVGWGPDPYLLLTTLGLGRLLRRHPCCPLPPSTHNIASDLPPSFWNSLSFTFWVADGWTKWHHWVWRGMGKSYINVRDDEASLTFNHLL